MRDLDYVGLDFLPDVFQPVGPAELGAAVAGLLRHHRENALTWPGWATFHCTSPSTAGPPGRLFHQSGLMTDDYTPKPAFETYRKLIAEFGRH